LDPERNNKSSGENYATRGKSPINQAMHTGLGEGVMVGLDVLALLVPTIVVNVPLLAICVFARHRLGPRRAAWVVAIGFVVACVWLMRDARPVGLPVAAYLALVYIPSMIAIGGIGWWIGRLIGRNFELSVPPDDLTRITR
jgi:hypothetical protein